jgi:hypothetical protein
LSWLLKLRSGIFVEPTSVTRGLWYMISEFLPSVCKKRTTRIGLADPRIRYITESAGQNVSLASFDRSAIA